ncbi:MAG: fatty acid CoA ligase family protein [Thermoguttaceae bacterium]|jgi:acyl-CoA synthetase (AMP-forming)/AMP-acid ligase II
MAEETSKAKSTSFNAGIYLTRIAERFGEKIAIAEPIKRGKKTLRDASGDRLFRTVTFAELERRSNAVAAGLHTAGLLPGMKIVLMVRHGIDFITLVYGLFKAGAVLVMIDPGMGMTQMLGCLRSVAPDGFTAIPAVQTARSFLRGSFPRARVNLTVGPTWVPGRLTLKKLLRRHRGDAIGTVAVAPDDPAAIIFTSGSTGPAKGVLYTHHILQTQVEEIQKRYTIEPGTVDLAAFPFFGLFNAAMGSLTVIPDMDTSRPASVDPAAFVEVANRWKITQSFASPAVWRKVTDYCMAEGKSIPTLRRAIAAGAPFPIDLLDDFLKILHPKGDIFTPYGATESLPVASIGAREILAETAVESRNGKGTCVGKRFEQIKWRVIPITDEPIGTVESVPEMPLGEIGELILTGPQVTREYVTRVEENRYAKIRDAEGHIWHRIGDVGRLDAKDRFWFCGRKAHRVETADGTFFSVPCEAILNQHPDVARTALAGIPAEDGLRKPVIFIEPKKESFPKNKAEKEALIGSVRALAATSPITEKIEHFLICSPFPVDVRHNAKINREKLSETATAVLCGK